jgi:hypothetical protein
MERLGLAQDQYRYTGQHDGCPVNGLFITDASIVNAIEGRIYFSRSDELRLNR